MNRINTPGILLTVVCTICLFRSEAQVRITGEVVYKGKGLTDALVYDGGEREVVTDSLGRFEILIDSLGTSLHVGRLGYRPIEYKVVTEEHLIISLPRKQWRKRNRQRICGFCFVAGTQICMPGNVTNSIEAVVVGDTILAMDPIKRTIQPSVVLQVDSVVHSDLVDIEFADGRRLVCTADHPIYVGGKGWSTAGGASSTFPRLQVGDKCFVHINGTYIEVAVVTITTIPGRMLTYNISRSTNGRSYFANGVLVSDESEWMKLGDP